MKKLVTVLMIALALIGLLVGCAAAAQPQKDTVRLSINMALPTINPMATASLQAYYAFNQVYEGLLSWHELERKIEPRVAERYDVNDKSTVYTFHLQPNGKFHNGDEITADDVAFSYESAMSAPQMAAFTGGIESFRAVDKKTFEITLKHPNAPFLTDICNVMIISKREAQEQGDDFGKKISLAGTGPYYFATLDPSTKWTLKAFPDYYRGEARIKNIEYTVVTDSSAGVIAVERGELSWYNAPVSSWAQLKSNPNLSTELVPANHISLYSINWMANEVLANDHVRKAIAYAIDEESCNLAAFDGLALVNEFIVDPMFVNCAPTEVMSYPYDPVKAKEELALAGYPDGVHIGEILCEPGSHYMKSALVIQACLEEVGITVDLDLDDQGTELARAYAQEYDTNFTGFSNRADFNAFRKWVHTDNIGAAYVNFKGDKFNWKRMDELFDLGAAASDPAKRVEYYTELMNIVMDTACYIPVYHRISPYVWQKGLHVVNNPNYYQVYDWYWE